MAAEVINVTGAQAQWAELLRNGVALAHPGVPPEALHLHQAASMAASDEGSDSDSRVRGARSVALT